MDYTVQFSDRKTYSITITDDLQILVKAPNGTTKPEIEQLLNKHARWINTHLEKKKNAGASKDPLTPERIKELKKLAQEYLPARTEAIGKIMGITPSSVKITSAKKRFGSCSSKNSICYSFHLMEYPAEAIDYVIVHELAHIKHKNHGKHFYALIEKYLPDYKERIKLLKN
jgi:predicted metal-dependent hydrolase